MTAIETVDLYVKGRLSMLAKEIVTFVPDMIGSYPVIEI